MSDVKKGIPEQDFKRILNSNCVSGDDEYSVCTQASLTQLGAFAEKKEFSSFCELMLCQLFEESCEGSKIAKEYIKKFGLKDRTQVEMVRLHCTKMLAFFMELYPLCVDAVCLIEQDTFYENDLNRLKNIHRARIQQQNSRFIASINTVNPSDDEIKKLIDENNYHHLRFFFHNFLELCYDEEGEIYQNKLSENVQNYLVMNGSENAIGMYLEYTSFCETAENSLFSKGNKFLILLYMMRYAPYPSSAKALISLGNIALSSFYDDEYATSKDEIKQYMKELKLRGWI